MLMLTKSLVESSLSYSLIVSTQSYKFPMHFGVEVAAKVPLSLLIFYPSFHAGTFPTNMMVISLR